MKKAALDRAESFWLLSVMGLVLLVSAAFVLGGEKTLWQWVIGSLF